MDVRSSLASNELSLPISILPAGRQEKSQHIYGGLMSGISFKIIWSRGTEYNKDQMTLNFVIQMQTHLRLKERAINYTRIIS